MGDDNKSGIVDILSQASSSALPINQGPPSNMTTMGPAPLQMPAPMPRFQAPEIQNAKAGNEFQTVEGRKRADKEALFHGIAQLVKAGGDYVQAKKNRALEADISRLISAQAGEKEAEEKMKQFPPGSPEYQQAEKDFATNRAIHNDITTDPKKNKQLQKAFNIDIFGGGKNKNENASLAAAMTKWRQEKAKADKEGKPEPLSLVAQRFQNQQPVRQQMSPQYAAQVQAIKDKVIPAANEQLRAYWENQRTLAQALTSEDRSKAMREHDEIIKKNAQLIADAKGKMAQAVMQNGALRYMSEEDRFDTMKEVAKIHSRDNDKRIAVYKEIAEGKNKVAEDKIKAAKDAADDRNKTAQEKVKAYREYVGLLQQKNGLSFVVQQQTQLNNQYKILQAENAKNQAELDKKGTSIAGVKISAASSKDASEMRIKINMNNMLMQSIQNNLQELDERVKQSRLIGTAIGLGEPQSTNVGGPASDAGTTLDNPNDAEADAERESTN